MNLTALTNEIHFRNLRGDLFGGVTAAVIALPMALAFGVASGAGPVAGLYGAVLVGFFAALFGGTPALISEPTGPMTVVMTAVIAKMMAAYPEDPDTAMAMAFTVVMMAGIFQIIFGALRLGRYITLMPYTVISGFMSGIGLILIILQLGPLLGHASPGGGVLGMIRSLPTFLTTINPPEAILGLMTIALLVLTPSRVKRYVPPQLIALVVCTILSLVLFNSVEIRRIGAITQGLPSFHLPVFAADQLKEMLIDAVMLGMLGCIDALLTSVIADSLTRTEHDSNKELVGQGIGNLMSGMFGGIAGAGATMGTVVNIQAGGRTAVSGLTRALILLLVVVWAGGLTAPIPMAVLAGIAFKVGVDIVDWDFLKRAHHVSWKGAVIMYGVIGLTVFVDLIVAVGVGVFVANILTIERLSKIRAKNVKAITDADDQISLTEEEKQLITAAQGRVLLFHLSGPMIFGVSKAIAREHAIIDDYEALVLDLSDVPHLGVTSSLAIENAIKEAYEKGRHVFVVGAAGQTLKRLERFGIMRFVPTHCFLPLRVEALRQSVALVKSSAAAAEVLAIAAQDLP